MAKIDQALPEKDQRLSGVLAGLQALWRNVHFYLLAILTVSVAAVLRSSLGDVLGPTSYPFFLFNLAVVICAWFGTLGSSLLCAILGGFVADYLFVDPKYTIGPTSFRAWIAMFTYLLVSVSIVMFAEAYRRAIRRSQNTGSRLKLALSVANASTFDWDPRSDKLMWPDEYRGVFGAQGVPAKLPDWLSHVHPEDRKRVTQSLLELVNSGNEQCSIEFRIFDADSRLHWEHCRLSAFRESTSEQVRVIGALIDVTDLKNAEAMLVRSEKLASAGKLAATVAHEVNNPLAAATNLLFLARSTTHDDLVKEYLDHADQQLLRVAAAARRTLAFYKEHSNPALLDVNNILEKAAWSIVSKVEAKKVSISIQCEKGMQIPGVSGELEHAFSNLLANSVDAVAMEGSVLVRARRLRNRHAGQPSVRVSIADDGPGVRRADRERIFEPFFSTKGAAGTGLGLWITQDIVRRHSGSIRVLSRTSGKRTGTVVSVTLPALAAASATAPMSSAPAESYHR